MFPKDLCVRRDQYTVWVMAPIRSVPHWEPQRNLARAGFLTALLLTSFGCARVMPSAPAAPAAPPLGPDWSEVGVASWYGPPFHGRTTASGEVYDMEAMTAAHQTLPFGTVLSVWNFDNGLTTTVRVNDRGPFVRNRIVDLSRRAARELDMIRPGTAQVRLSILSLRVAAKPTEATTGRTDQARQDDPR